MFKYKNKFLTKAVVHSIEVVAIVVALNTKTRGDSQKTLTRPLPCESDKAREHDLEAEYSLCPDISQIPLFTYRPKKGMGLPSGRWTGKYYSTIEKIYLGLDVESILDGAYLLIQRRSPDRFTKSHLDRTCNV